MTKAQRTAEAIRATKRWISDQDDRIGEIVVSVVGEPDPGTVGQILVAVDDALDALADAEENDGPDPETDTPGELLGVLLVATVLCGLVLAQAVQAAFLLT